jgi:hypothetical protein
MNNQLETLWSEFIDNTFSTNLMSVARDILSTPNKEKENK